MDRVSFTRAVTAYQDTVYRIALHALGDPQDADDAVQEVFLRLFRREEAFDGEEHLRRWLLRVAVNVCHDMRKSAWWRRAPLNEAAGLPVFDRPEEGALYETVMALPEKYRVVLDLFYYEELSTGEIAEMLGLTRTAVTTRLSRARALLKERLGEVWPDD